MTARHATDCRFSEVCACQAGMFELQWLHSLHGEVTHLNTTMNPAMKKNIWMI